MSQQEKQPSQQQSVTQPVHAAASLPYQIAYISVPQSGTEGGGQAIRAVPFHIVPVLGQMQGLQMHHVAQLLQGQQVQQAVYQDPKRQGAVVVAQGAGTGQAVLANLDPAMRAALAPPPTVSTALKGHNVAGSQQTKSGATTAAAPTASDAAEGAAAAAPAGAGEAASSAAAEGTGKQPVREDGGPATTTNDKETERSQKGTKCSTQRGQQKQQAELPTIAVLSTAPDGDVPTSPAAAAMAAAAAAAASQIPAAAQAAIAAAEAAAAAAATAGGVVSPRFAGTAGMTQAEAAAAGASAPGQHQHYSGRNWDMLLGDSDGEGDVQAAGETGAGAAAQQAMGSEAAAKQPTAHDIRVKQRQAFNLKRKFADLTAQIEGALCEVRGFGFVQQPTPTC